MHGAHGERHRCAYREARAGGQRRGKRREQGKDSLPVEVAPLTVAVCLTQDEDFSSQDGVELSKSQKKKAKKKSAAARKQQAPQGKTGASKLWDYCVCLVYQYDWHGSRHVIVATGDEDTGHEPDGCPSPVEAPGRHAEGTNGAGPPKKTAKKSERLIAKLAPLESDSMPVLDPQACSVQVQRSL